LPSETRPNWKEQFGRVLVEAMASGVPVLGSNSGEIPNLINASAGGRIFPEGDAAALAEALREMMENGHQRAAFARAGHAWALKNISLSAVAASMARTMEAALARKDQTEYEAAR
jgi:glycosyltransferase involved in cell wall biosynthesis